MTNAEKKLLRDTLGKATKEEVIEFAIAVQEQFDTLNNETMEFYKEAGIDVNALRDQ